MCRDRRKTRCGGRPEGLKSSSLTDRLHRLNDATGPLPGHAEAETADRSSGLGDTMPSGASFVNHCVAASPDNHQCLVPTSRGFLRADHVRGRTLRRPRVRLIDTKFFDSSSFSSFLSSLTPVFKTLILSRCLSESSTAPLYVVCSFLIHYCLFFYFLSLP